VLFWGIKSPPVPKVEEKYARIHTEEMNKIYTNMVCEENVLFFHNLYKINAWSLQITLFLNPFIYD